MGKVKTVLIKRKNIFLAIIILFLLIFTSIIIFLFPNKNNNSSEWKTYSNKEANYQISYPKEWAKDEIYNYYDWNDDLVVMNKSKSQQIRLGFLPGEIQLSVGHVGSFSDFDKYLKDKIGFIRTNKVGGKLTKIENIKIANNSGVKFSYEENYEGEIYGLINYFKAGKTIFSISFFTYDKKTMDSYQKEIGEIINSFKLFLN